MNTKLYALERNIRNATRAAVAQDRCAAARLAKHDTKVTNLLNTMNEYERRAARDLFAVVSINGVVRFI